jgi:hypothetical protein
MEPRLMVDRCTGGEIFFGDAPGEETGEAGGVSPNPPTSPQAHNAMKGPLLVQVDGRSGAGESYAWRGSPRFYSLLSVLRSLGCLLFHLQGCGL